MPKAKGLLGKEELEELGAEVEARKEELKTTGRKPAKRGREPQSPERTPGSGVAAQIQEQHQVLTDARPIPTVGRRWPVGA